MANLDQTRKRIIQAALDIQEGGGNLNQFIDEGQLSERVGIPIDEMRDYLQVMADEGYLKHKKTFGGVSVALTSRARLAVREPEFLSSVEAQQRQRFEFLHRLMEASKKNTLINALEIGKQLSLDEKAVERIVKHLEGEKLLKQVTEQLGVIRITHEGNKAVEEAFVHPQKPTEHFPAINNYNTISIQSMVNSQFQQATSGSTQTGAFSGQNAELEAWIEELKEKLSELGLSDTTEKEAGVDIATVEMQLRSPKPKPVIITESLRSLRIILEAAAGNALAAGLLNQLSTFF